MARKFTEEDELDIVRLYAVENAKTSRIARLYSTTVARVNRILNSHGINPKARGETVDSPMSVDGAMLDTLASRLETGTVKTKEKLERRRIRRENGELTLDGCAIEAQKLGMSYGYYMGMRHAMETGAWEWDPIV